MGTADFTGTQAQALEEARLARDDAEAESSRLVRILVTDDLYVGTRYALYLSVEDGRGDPEWKCVRTGMTRDQVVALMVQARKTLERGCM